MTRRPAHLTLRRPLPAWVLVGLLHLGLLLTLWTLPPTADRGRAASPQPALVVTLLDALRPRPTPATPATAPEALRRSMPTPREVLRLPSPPSPEPQAITLPAEPVPAPAAPAAPTDTPAPPAATAAAPPAPLNLTLPRGASAPWRASNPALDDPRSNTAKLTMEQKLANAMGGDGEWHMERLDGDHIRYRRGAQCVLMTRSRAGQLELGNGAFRNSWLVGGC